LKKWAEQLKLSAVERMRRPEPLYFGRPWKMGVDGVEFKFWFTK